MHEFVSLMRANDIRPYDAMYLLASLSGHIRDGRKAEMLLAAVGAVINRPPW